jgi:hypothetical protein
VGKQHNGGTAVYHQQTNEQVVSKHTITSFNNSNGSNFYNTAAVKKLGSVDTTAESTQNASDYQRQLSLASKQSPLTVVSQQQSIPMTTQHQRFKTQLPTSTHNQFDLSL